MAGYIDREKLIKRLHNAEENYKADHDYDIDNDPFSDGILSAMFSVNQIVGSEPTADVVERSKIDKAIEEIIELDREDLTIYDGVSKLGSAWYVCLDEVLEILKRNIGE